jgi:vacuolar-type H+-ATPase subunit C/Vma6
MMQVAVEDYEYVYIKLALLRNIVMQPQEIKRIRSYNDLQSLATYIANYFPGLNIKTQNTIDFERALWSVYFKIMGKIMASAPSSIQKFVHSILLKYEIWNIKVNVLGILANLPLEQRNLHTFDDVAPLLGRKEFSIAINKAKNFAEIEHAAEKTPYLSIIKTGFLLYRQTNQIFWLECELDRFNYQSLLDSINYYQQDIRLLIQDYIISTVDFYNFNLMYRALYNQIGLDQIRKYIIHGGSIFNDRVNRELLQAKNLGDFLSKLQDLFQSSRIIQKIITIVNNPTPELLEQVRQLLFKPVIAPTTNETKGNIPLSTISRVLNIIFNKEFEIKEILSVANQIALQMVS